MFCSGEQSTLKEKLHNLERKIHVGGENLLEKAEAQEQLLAAAAAELEERKRLELLLRQALKQKEAERLDIEERYSSLQEEAAGKQKKLKKVWSLLQGVRAEMTDVQQDHQREMEGLLDNLRQLNRELRLQSLIISTYIPTEYQVIFWNSENRTDAYDVIFIFAGPDWKICQLEWGYWRMAAEVCRLHWQQYAQAGADQRNNSWKWCNYTVVFKLHFASNIIFFSSLNQIYLVCIWATPRTEWLTTENYLAVPRNGAPSRQSVDPVTILQPSKRLLFLQARLRIRPAVLDQRLRGVKFISLILLC